jgi:sugar phosphate isomerase/epimerase
MAGIPLAVQMYTLRETCGKDFPGTLKAVADIGYDGVELAGTYGLSAKEISALLDDLGLGRAGTHSGVDGLRDNFDETVADLKILKSDFVTIPGLPEEMWESAEAWKKTAALLQEIGTKLRAEGIQLSYHNHAHEFQVFDGVYGLDILYGNTTPDALHGEIDTYWVQYGGVDPVEYLKKVSNRLSLVHIKDMQGEGDDRTFTEIGNGILDWDGIFAVAEKAGAKWAIVEQDTCPGPELDSVRISYENLKRMGKA